MKSPCEVPIVRLPEMQKAQSVALNRAGLRFLFGRRSVSKSSDPGSRHQKQPFLRQHRLKRWPEPQGQRSFLPSFSSSNLSPWTVRSPRLTCVSDGYPRRRLLIGSKKMAVRRTVRALCVAWRTSGTSGCCPSKDKLQRKRFTQSPSFGLNELACIVHVASLECGLPFVAAT